MLGVAMLIAGGLLGGGIQVAERVFGLPNEVTALGAPWLVTAFAVGTLIRGRLTASLAGALMLSTGTALYYAAIVYGDGAAAYATVMTVTWGAVAAAGGAVMALTGSWWRTASGNRAALLAALPAAALLGEAVLLSFSWRGDVAGIALLCELVCGVVILLMLSRRRVSLSRALASALALALAFALAEAEIRGVMRAAGWHGA